MSDRAELSRSIDEIIARLSHPLAADELANGWSEEKRARWRRWFVEHRDQISENPKLAGIARAMDFDGIVGGELVELAAHIGNTARRLHAA